MILQKKRTPAGVRFFTMATDQALERQAAGHTGGAMAAQPAGLTMIRPWIKITRMITGTMNWK